MKSRTSDRRVQKTVKLLHDSLISLVVEKKYELISVQEILDRANVGRSTFYTHYRDKDQLLLKAFDGLRNELEAAQAAAAPVPGRSFERIIAFSQAMFAHAHGYRRVYGALIRSQAGPIVQQRIQRIISDLIRVEFTKEWANRKRPETGIPTELLIHYLASTLLSLLEWWMEDRNDLSPESMNTIYRSLVFPALT